jgi:hypothetical protein
VLVLLPQDNLLLYNHAKLMAEDNHSSGKEYLVSIMFSHYDQNNNGALEREELEQVCWPCSCVSFTEMLSGFR